MSDADRTSGADEPAPPVLGRACLSPPGWDAIWISWSERGLRSLGWREPTGGAVEPLPACFAEPLLAHFAGAVVDLNAIPIDPIGTKFQQGVWAALRRVPRGTVRTYAGIASDIGSPRAMRAVGSANGANPIAIVVPCHRIVEVGMRLGGYSGGLDRKRRLLEIEGVRITGDVVQPGQLKLL